MILPNIEAGTIRTAWADPSHFPYADLTSAEMARKLGSAHLYGLLTPRIQNGVPAAVLQKLQDQFHELIKVGFDLVKNHQYLRLPDLFPLTEMDVPEMWFPLKTPNPDFSKWVQVNNMGL